jgi:hypothetical protein
LRTNVQRDVYGVKVVGVIFPVEPGRRDGGVGNPVERYVVECERIRLRNREKRQFRGGANGSPFCANCAMFVPQRFGMKNGLDTRHEA